MDHTLAGKGPENLEVLGHVPSAMEDAKKMQGDPLSAGSSIWLDRKAVHGRGRRSPTQRRCHREGGLQVRGLPRSCCSRTPGREGGVSLQPKDSQQHVEGSRKRLPGRKGSSNRVAFAEWLFHHQSGQHRVSLEHLVRITFLFNGQVPSSGKTVPIFCVPIRTRHFQVLPIWWVIPIPQ